MNEVAEKPAEAATKTVRPTKKQQELLTFIEAFIAEHGYSPSYREIMTGLNYTSVATVSLHVNNLIRRGHLQKRDRSARSLEVVKPHLKPEVQVAVKQLKTGEEKWLVDKVELFFKEVESAVRPGEKQLDSLQILIAALKVLGLDGAASSFSTRLAALKKKPADSQYSV
jgi:SOS-response transcriptional repressor LexA